METTVEKVGDIQKCLFNGFLIYIIHSPPGMINWNISSSIFCSDENLSAIQQMSLNDKIEQEKALLSQAHY